VEGFVRVLLEQRCSWLCECSVTSENTVNLCLDLPLIEHPSCSTHSYWQCNKAQCMRFEVLTAVLLEVEIFWDVTQFHWVNSSPRFQGVISPRKFLNCLTLRVKPLRSFETPCTIHPTTQHHIPED